MTREEAKRRAELYSAVANGKTLQIQSSVNGEWIDVQNATLVCIDDDRFIYRVKPDPRYRPFRNQEECWNEMLKHQPFGWLKTKTDGRYTFIGEHYSFQKMFTGGVLKSSTNGLVPYAFDVFDSYTFADGTPFGMPEEE